MIREEECVGHNVPGLVPRNVFLVDEDAHQFRDGKCWMCLAVMM